MTKEYKLQSRLQDEGWEDVNMSYGDLGHAINAARKLDGFFFGMVRVVETKTGKVIAEFPSAERWATDFRAQYVRDQQARHRTDRPEDIAQVLSQVVEECKKARAKHPPLNSTHEAHSVILEEFEEWWDSVKADKPDDKELLSVAAMAVLAIVELRGKNRRERTKMKVFELDDGEQWWYAAESKENALRLHLQPLLKEGTDLSDLSKVDVKDLYCSIEEIEITELSPETILPVFSEDKNETVSQTAAEWALEGEGLIACTVW